MCGVGSLEIIQWKIFWSLICSIYDIGLFTIDMYREYLASKDHWFENIDHWFENIAINKHLCL